MKTLDFCESYSNEKLITKQTKAPLMMSVSYAMTRIHAFIFARLLDVSWKHWMKSAGFLR